MLSCLNRSSCLGFLHGCLPSASQEKTYLTCEVRGQLPIPTSPNREGEQRHALRLSTQTISGRWRTNCAFLVFYGCCQFQNDREWLWSSCCDNNVQFQVDIILCLGCKMHHSLDWFYGTFSTRCTFRVPFLPSRQSLDVGDELITPRVATAPFLTTGICFTLLHFISSQLGVQSAIVNIV